MSLTSESSPLHWQHLQKEIAIVQVGVSHSINKAWDVIFAHYQFNHIVPLTVYNCMLMCTGIVHQGGLTHIFEHYQFNHIVPFSFFLVFFLWLHADVFSFHDCMLMTRLSLVYLAFASFTSHHQLTGCLQICLIWLLIGHLTIWLFFNYRELFAGKVCNIPEDAIQSMCALSLQPELSGASLKKIWIKIKLTPFFSITARYDIWTGTSVARLTLFSSSEQKW